MKRFWLLFALAGFMSCKQSIEQPQAFLDSLLAHPHTFADGSFEYRLNALPMDYFLARQLVSQGDSLGRIDVEGARLAVQHEYGGARYYLLRLGLDSSSAGNPGAQADLAQRMMLLQSHQETARQEIIGHLADGESIRPDIFIAEADWINKDGVTILFGFRKDASKRLERIEFGKSFVYSRDQFVDVRGLESKFRFKG